jgi:acyl-CoA dehydrogenase
VARFHSEADPDHRQSLVLVPLDTPGVEVVRDLSTFAESRLEIDQARLLVLRTAWLMDTVGNHGARTEIAGIKVVAARTAARVIDRAIQVFGAAGLSGDTPLALFYALARQLRIVDGPDEVHLRTIARHELKRAS